MKMDPQYYRFCKPVLAGSPLFKGLADPLLDNMLTKFRRDTWRRGAHLNPAIFQQRFFLLIEGRIEVMSINPKTGRSVTLSLLGPGDGHDMVTLLDARPHEAESVAVDDVALISVPIQEARSWLDRHPEFNHNFLHYLGKQIRYREDLANDLALYPTMTRLARLILRHVDPQQQTASDSGYHLELINDLNDESMARMVGSVRQVVNRHLHHWREQGVLHKTKFRTDVAELKTLKEYASVELPVACQTANTGK